MLSTISSLPSVPNRNSPQTFETDSDSFFGSLPTLLSELNSFASEINTLGYKTPVIAATTANINLSGLQTIDGKTLSANDRVLVKNQTNSQDNGVYIASTSTWSRAPDMDSSSDVSGAFIPVIYGSSQGGRVYYTTFNASTNVLGTSSIVFKDLASSAIVGTVPVDSGGTGISSYNAGDLLYANSATSLTKLNAASAGNVLKSGTSPSWGKASLTSDISGVLPAANGGTGMGTPLTSGLFLTSTGSGWSASNLPNASTSVRGAVILSTYADIKAGTDATTAITPSVLRDGLVVSKYDNLGGSFAKDIVDDIPYWCNVIHVLITGVSLFTTGTGTSIIIKIGSNISGYVNTTYKSSCTGGGATDTSTQSIIVVPSSTGTSSYSGSIKFYRFGSGVWVGDVSIIRDDTSTPVHYFGSFSANIPDYTTQHIEKLRISTKNSTNQANDGTISFDSTSNVTVRYY